MGLRNNRVHRPSALLATASLTKVTQELSAQMIAFASRFDSAKCWFCTVKISENLPAFETGMERQGRKLLLEMIKEALASNPSSVGRIIREVLQLPHDDADRFALLLKDVPLSKVIGAAHMVKERLDRLLMLEAMVTLDPFDKVIEERTQLQHLLADNLAVYDYADYV